MKALIFMLVLALMPTIFRGQKLVEIQPQKVKMIAFDAIKFNYQVDSCLYYVKIDSTKLSTPKSKRKSRKQQGKTPLLLELGKYTVGVVLAFFLTCPK